MNGDQIDDRGYDRERDHRFGQQDGSLNPAPRRDATITNWVDPAIAWTKVLLFKPFDLVKWLVIGFCAWLATLTEGGTNFRVNLPADNSGGNPVNDFGRWIENNTGLFVAIILLVILIGFIVSLLVVWLSSRGKFMFLDNIVHNRAEIKQPWRELARQGDSLFGFKVVFWLLCFLAVVVLGGISALLIVPGVSNGQLQPLGIVGVVFASVSFISYLVVVIAIGFLLEDIVIPIMYVRRCTCRQAWREFRAVFDGHGATLILYFLFKILLGIVVGLLALVTACLLCCISVWPYLGTVVLLPFIVFARSYSLYFMQQFHGDYQLLPLNPYAREAMPVSREVR